MKKQIGILMAVWLLTSALPILAHADTSYLLIQGPFGSGTTELTYKWQVNYPTGYLVTGQDLLDAVFGIPVADGTYSDPVFGDRPYFVAGNASRGASYIEFFGSYLTLSFTLNSTLANINNATPAGTSTLGWNYYVAGGSGAYGGTYPNTGDWLLAGDGESTRFLSNGSYDGLVYGNTGYDPTGNPATTGSTTAVIDNTSNADDPSDFTNKAANTVLTTLFVTLQGKYTLLLSATATSATVPQGSGYATMTVTGKDRTIVAGKLPDGESFTVSGLIVSSTAGTELTIDKALSYPSVTTRGAKGSLAGTLHFALQTGVSNFNGTLEWKKPPQNKGAYPASIDTNLDVVGSFYVPPGKRQSVLRGFTIGTLALSDTTGIILSGTAQLGANNQLTLLNPADGVKIRINPANGMLSGSFLYPGKTPKRIIFDGVLFQSQTNGGGFFIGPDGGGKVTLSQ